MDVEEVGDVLQEDPKSVGQGKKRTREEMQERREKILHGLDYAQVNAMIVSSFQAAYEKAGNMGRKTLNEKLQEELRVDVEMRTLEKFSSFSALKSRYKRILANNTVERKPGSGRKSKFTDEIVERTKKTLRDSNYEISFPEAHETLLEEYRKENREDEVPGRTQFLKFLRESGQFKRRRKKYYLTLTDKHK
jgi:hypothetical protein